MNPSSEAHPPDEGSVGRSEIAEAIAVFLKPDLGVKVRDLLVAQNKVGAVATDGELTAGKNFALAFVRPGGHFEATLADPKRARCAFSLA